MHTYCACTNTYARQPLCECNEQRETDGLEVKFGAQGIEYVLCECNEQREADGLEVKFAAPGEGSWLNEQGGQK